MAVVYSQMHFLLNPNPNPYCTFFTSKGKSPYVPPIPKTLLFSNLPSAKSLNSNILTSKNLPKPSSIVKTSASSSTAHPSRPHLPLQPLLSNPTRTLSTIFALAFSISNQILQSVLSLTNKLNQISPDERATIQSLRENAHCVVGPLFFAALRDRPSGYLNTPLTVVVAGMAKWLDIYNGEVMVRVMLSWFPNVPWERQPLSTIRDISDPFLNLFRNIIPPIFDTLDVSSFLAFTFLGTLRSILYNSKGMYS